jgi:hypothetical protein
MSGDKRLKKALTDLSLSKKNREEFINAELGTTVNNKLVVRVDGRDGYHWARIRGNQSEVVQVYNTQTSPVYGLPVLIVRDDIDPTRYRVIERDLARYEDWGGSAYLPAHGNQHSFNRATGGGGDIVWVFARQMMPLLAYPSGTSGANVVFVNEFTYYQGTTFTYSPTQISPDLISLKPSGTQGAIMVLLYLDSATNPTLVAGSFFDASLTGSSDVIPQLPAMPDVYGVPVAGIRMVTGTSSILWDNIYDVRPWIIADGFIPTGTVAGHTIQDEGSNLPYRTNLNFTGDIVWVIDDSGNNQTDVIISGSAAGFTQEIFDDGASQGNDLDLDFGLGLDVSVTGSVRAEIDAHVFEESGSGLVRKLNYGGNDRGDNSVDLQTIRALGSHVASGAKSVIGGGENNAVSGAQSVIAGGSGNSISNNYGAIAGGLQNDISADYGSVPGGQGNEVGEQFAQASGRYAQASHYAEDSRSSGRHASSGDVQRMEFLLFKHTTNDTPTELLLGDVAGKRMNLPTDTSWGFNVMLVARDDGGETQFFKSEGLIDNLGGTTVLRGSTITSVASSGVSWDLEVKADDANNSLYLGVSGTAFTNILWSARVMVISSTLELS